MRSDTEKCSTCGKVVERKEVIKHDDYDEIVLTCGHKYRFFRRSIMENIHLSENVTARVIRFETEEDRINGFYELLLSKSQFRGIEKNKFEVTDEQRKILTDKQIKYSEAE
jgi:hypothetical protein